MKQEDAIKTLIQAVQIAQAKGAFTLDDAVVVKQAIDVFIKPEVKDKPIKSVEESEPDSK